MTLLIKGVFQALLDAPGAFCQAVASTRCSVSFPTGVHCGASIQRLRDSTTGMEKNVDVAIGRKFRRHGMSWTIGGE